MDSSHTLAPASAPPLRLETALQLLQHAGHVLPAAAEMSLPWLQSLIDGLCDLSCRDALTGLPNRRTFELALDREVDRVARAGEPALVLMIDIDHFKKVNDVHGHATGDLVLKNVAKALLEAVRPMDTVARVGGEEFAIILPNCPPAFAPAVAERIRRGVERKPAITLANEKLAVSVRLGGAFAPQWVRSSAVLWLERADQQLYRAKSSGRNRACLEQPAVSQVSVEEKDLLFAGATQSQDFE